MPLDLQFVRPEYLAHALVAACAVLALGVLLILQRKRALAWRSRVVPGRIYGTPRMLAAATTTALIGLGLALILLKPFIPRYHDRQLYEPLDIVVALDVSFSMLAPATPDRCGPSRLQAAQAELEVFLQKLEEHKSDRVGLVAFTKFGYRLVPLMTRDYALVSRIMHEMSEREVASGSLQFGTNHWDAIAQAGKVFDAKSRNKRVLVIVTDGEMDAPDVVLEGSRIKALEALGRYQGIKVVVVGIGHPLQEYPIIKRRGAGGCPAEFFVQEEGDDKGQLITTRVDIPRMQATASEFGGSYRHSDTGSDLADLLHDTIAVERVVAGTERTASQRPLDREFTIGVLALMALLIILKTP